MSFACTGCERFAFAEPMLCFWCRRRQAEAPVPIPASTDSGKNENRPTFLDMEPPAPARRRPPLADDSPQLF